MKNKGFTLVEVLAVLSLIGVVMVFFSPMILDAFYKSKHMISDLEKDTLLDAAKMYITDFDLGVKSYVYEGKSNIDINGHTYEKGSKMSAYDFKTYAINNDGIIVNIRELVEGKYYDKNCDYNNPQTCKIKENCKLKVKINGEKTKDGRYYVTNGYEAQISEGCEK